MYTDRRLKLFLYIYFHGKVEDKIVPVYALKAYVGSGGTAALIPLNFRRRCRW